MIKLKFNNNWVYHFGGGSGFDTLLGTGDGRTKAVMLPHDASVSRVRNPEEPNGSGNGFFREETCYYTKEFELTEDAKDKNVYLEFEGIYQNSFVYVNGVFAGKCPYGYGNFYVDATPYVVFDKKNVIRIVVKNGVPSGRWYTGSGIYRDVNLMIANRLHFAADEVQLAAVEIEEDQAIIRFCSTVEYTGVSVRDARLYVELLDQKGEVVASDEIPITVLGNSKAVYTQKVYVENPRLWDVDDPYLYQYRAVLKEGITIIDEESGNFGIRKIQLDKKHGFRLNGRTVNLRGGCIHHDNGITGTAEFAHAADFRVKRLKEAGYNSIRSSHYPMSRRLLDACDRYGILVMDEYSDAWTTTKVDFDYGIHVTEWWEHDLINLVKKDYNHPSVIMYSIGNEIPETGNKFNVQWGKKFADRLRELDDSRFITNSLNLMLSIMDRMGEFMEGAQGGEINEMMTNLGDLMLVMASSEMAGNLTEEACTQVDVTGYNYSACRYEQDGVLFPNRILVGSETYPRDLDVNWELVEKLPYVIGDYSWTAWDYLGEAGIGKISYGEKEASLSFYAPYPYKAAYCGDMNLLGDRRPISYWREMIWGLRKEPYISVQPPMYHDVKHNMSLWAMTDAVRSWNWKGQEGKAVIVEVYTPAEEAALYINNTLIEKKKVGTEKKYQVLFDTVYTPGCVEVVVYDNGEEVGRDSIVTAKDSVQICAKADVTELPADGSDIGYVEISIVDENRTLNPEADPAVTVSIDGPGVILGFGSADPENEENYFDLTAKAYEGRLRAAVRGTGIQGVVSVTLSAEGYESRTVEINMI